MVTRLSRGQWLLAGIIGAALLVLAVQIVNTRAVRNQLCDYAANESGCAASMSFGAVELSLPNGQSGGARTGPSQLHASTWLLRRTCDARWTLALGARLEADDVVSESRGRTFEIPHACLFTDGRRLDGRVDEAHLVVDGCRIKLAPFQFSAATELNASITATMDAATAQPCARLLRAGVGQLASTAIRDAALNFDGRLQGASVLRHLHHAVDSGRRRGRRSRSSALHDQHVASARGSVRRRKDDGPP